MSEIETGPRCGTCAWYGLPNPRKYWSNGKCRHRATTEIERRIGPCDCSPYDGNGCVCYKAGIPMAYNAKLDRPKRPCKAARKYHRVRLSIKEILRRMNG